MGTSPPEMHCLIWFLLSILCSDLFQSAISLHTSRWKAHGDLRFTMKTDNLSHHFRFSVCLKQLSDNYYQLGSCPKTDYWRTESAVRSYEFMWHLQTWMQGSPCTCSCRKSSFRQPRSYEYRSACTQHAKASWFRFGRTLSRSFNFYTHFSSLQD